MTVTHLWEGFRKWPSDVLLQLDENIGDKIPCGRARMSEVQFARRETSNINEDGGSEPWNAEVPIEHC
jgi:hypothetical protein